MTAPPAADGKGPGGELGWFWRELAPFRRAQLLAVGGLLGATLLSLVDPLIIKWLVDSGLKQAHWPAIVAAVGLFSAVYLARMLLLAGGNLVSARVFEQLTLRLRRRLLGKLLKLDASFFDRRPVGDLVHRVEQDVEQFGRSAVDLLPAFVGIVFGAASTLMIMVVLDWRLSLVVLPFVPALLLLRNHFRRVLERASDTTRQAVGERTSFLNECLGAASQVQLAGAERFFRRRYGRLAVRTSRAGLEQRKTELAYSASTFAILTLTTATVLLAGAREYSTGVLTLGGYIAFYTYLMRLFSPLSSAVETHARLKRAVGSIRRLAELETYRSTTEDRRGAPAVAEGEIRDLACRGLSFGYGEDRAVLEAIDLTIGRGERVALVGQSGSGKSTIAKLLVRLYDPGEGLVRLAGRDLRDVRLSSLREAVALVPSRPVIFCGSLRENVLLGHRGVEERELERLSRVVRFEAVVGRFSDGWDHRLGTGGAGLSDGEKQRLGLLRALVRDPQVLILDEATGALDPIIETELLDELSRHVEDRIVLLVTHRLAAACWADRILLLEEGKLAEVASPKEFADYAAAVSTDVWGGPSAKPLLERERSLALP